MRLLLFVLSSIASMAPQENPHWGLVVLGTDDGPAMAARIRAAKEVLDDAMTGKQVADCCATPPQWVITSGNTKKQLRKRLGVEARAMTAEIQPMLRGKRSPTHIPLLQEQASNNTAQNLVCVKALLESTRLAPAPMTIVVVTNHFHAPRVRDIAMRLAWWQTHPMVVLGAEDPPQVQWRQDAERDMYLPRMEADIQEALRLAQRGGCHTTHNACA